MNVLAALSGQSQAATAPLKSIRDVPEYVEAYNRWLELVTKRDELRKLISDLDTRRRSVETGFQQDVNRVLGKAGDGEQAKIRQQLETSRYDLQVLDEAVRQAELARSSAAQAAARQVSTANLPEYRRLNGEIARHLLALKSAIEKRDAFFDKIRIDSGADGHDGLVTEVLRPLPIVSNHGDGEDVETIDRWIAEAKEFGQLP